jgi:hypothetical protein
MGLERQRPYSDLLSLLKADGNRESSTAAASWSVPEWEAVAGLAARYGLSAYLVHRMREKTPVPTLPPAVERRLREITLRNASRNSRLARLLGRTVAALSEGGVPVVPLKGVHLALDVYENIALRSMRDVDILVRGDDLHRAVTILFQSGFRAGDERGGRYIEWSAGGGYHVPSDAKHFFDLLHPEWPVKLDLHCSLVEETQPFRIDADGLWSRTLSFRSEGIEARLLAPEDFLLYQCLHASVHHSFETGLRPFCDIFETLRRYRGSLDWERVRSRALEWGAERSARLTLRLTSDLLGADVPEDVFTGPGTGDRFEQLVVLTRDRVLLNTTEARKIPFRLVRYWRTRRGCDLAAALLKGLFIPRRKLAAKYNLSPGSGRVFLYYPLRLRDLARRWGGMTWDIIARRGRIEKNADYAGQTESIRAWLIAGKPE